MISTKNAGKDENLTFIAALLSNFHSLLISLFDKAIKHRSIFNFGVNDVWCIQMHVKWWDGGAEEGDDEQAELE